MILKMIYTLFLALLIALFVGLGIDAFYQGPIMPEYPVEMEGPRPVDYQETELEKQTRLDFSEKQSQYEKDNKVYNRNVAIISLIFAVAILVASLTLFAKIKMIADGILLGGVFTTVYSLIRGLMSEDSLFRFLIVSVGLIIALALGYVKFVKNREALTKENMN